MVREAEKVAAKIHRFFCPDHFLRRGPQHGERRWRERMLAVPVGGGRIDEMYTLNRMLDGDPFYVKITN